MAKTTLLTRHWHTRLAKLCSRAEQNLIVLSPFVTLQGTDLVSANLTDTLRLSGQLTFLTDLSPINICQSATDPAALRSLADSSKNTEVRHLPRIHAKVYVADNKVAIVTSANLTSGGLYRNFEYGVEISDSTVVERIRRDVAAYAELGAIIGISELVAYCCVAEKLQSAFSRQQRSVSSKFKSEFQNRFRELEDQLIRLRLAGGAVHTVFERTIEYLLREHGPLTTQQIHPLVASIHPDLCDDTVDRVIDGKRFGKKWKHAVRTAQQQLKRKGIINLDGVMWRLTTNANNKGAGQ